MSTEPRPTDSPVSSAEGSAPGARKRAARRLRTETQPPGKTARPRRSAGAVAKSRLPVIHQIFFEPAQQPLLDPAFTPLDNAGHDDREREFAVFERLAAGAPRAADTLWGAVSWRFGEKTGMSGADLRAAIAAHPGFDLYFCNPNPHCEALYGNFWLHGATTHPGFKEVVEAFFTANGIEADEFITTEPSESFASCNYFVGTSAFWKAYLPFVRGLLDTARRAMPPGILRLADSRMSDPHHLHPGATYWPFIIERLLPIFLRRAGAGLKVHKIALPAQDAKLNVHQRRLREMKDVAHRTKSAWLYSCWVQYRNLYLQQAAGRDWCQRNLPLISPTAIHFA